MIELTIDIETTSFGKDAEILQLAFITNKGQTFSAYYKPKFVSEWPHAEKVNGITPEMVEETMFFDDTNNLAFLQRQINDADVVLGYNIKRFDQPVLERYNLDFSKTTVIDVLLDEKKLSNNWLTLKECAKKYGYKGANWHDALADVKATKYIHTMHRKGVTK